MRPTKNVPVIKISFAFMDSTDSPEDGKRFFSFLKNSYPEIFPQFAGFTEPINNPVPAVEACAMLAEYWQWGGMWKRRKNIVSEWMLLTPAKRYPDGMTKLSLWMKLPVSFDLVEFACALAREMRADSTVAVVDCLEFRNKSDAIKYNHRKQLSLANVRTFSESQVNLGWMHFMTDRYLDIFYKQDAERIRSLNAEELGFFDVKELPEGLFWQITETPMDVRDDVDGFNLIRERAKPIIGSEYFVDVEEYYQQALEDTANFGKRFATPSVLGVAIEDKKEREAALSVLAQNANQMPEWERVLRKHITDPVKLQQAIDITGQALSVPMPDEELHPEEFEAEKLRRAALLREMIFPTSSENLRKPWSLKRIFGVK